MLCLPAPPDAGISQKNPAPLSSATGRAARPDENDHENESNNYEEMTTENAV